MARIKGREKRNKKKRSSRDQKTRMIIKMQREIIPEERREDSLGKKKR